MTLLCSAHISSHPQFDLISRVAIPLTAAHADIKGRRGCHTQECVIKKSGKGTGFTLPEDNFEKQKPLSEEAETQNSCNLKLQFKSLEEVTTFHVVA